MMSAEACADEQQAPPGFVLKNTVLHYSYLMSDCIGQGYSSKVYQGVDDHTGTTLKLLQADS